MAPRRGYQTPSGDCRAALFGARIHGTLAHMLWGDQQWMPRFDAWPKPSTPIKQSAGMIEDFAVLSAERE
jgi:hypothetical protein